MSLRDWRSGARALAANVLGTISRLAAAGRNPMRPPPPVAPADAPSGVHAFCARHYTALATAVLCLAAFNLTYRLGSELVSEWDEALYAITASEALEQRQWIGTTFLGNLDYYNLKPPLNVWLIALAFKVFGTNLIALRLGSAVAAWLTVAVLVAWARRCFGAAIALLSGLVLATCFAFIHEHAGRSANTDALFTLLILLTVVTLWAARTREWHRVWLGPLLAAAFLLRGPGMLMPLALIITVWVFDRRTRRGSWLLTAAAIVLFLIPVTAWVVARYRVDQWQFLNALFWTDFVAFSSTSLDGHSGGPFFYLNILQKHHFDWLLAGLSALLLYPVPWSRVRDVLKDWRDGLTTMLVAWAGVTLLVPTVIQTKLPWYLNTFYPLFAVGIAVLLAQAAARAVERPRAFRSRSLAIVFVAMLCVAETKLIWYSFHYRDLALSDQALMLAERDQLAGRRLFRDRSDNAGAFVARHVVRAEPLHAATLESFLHSGRTDDYFLTSQNLTHPDVELVGSDHCYRLYRRRGDSGG